MKLYINRICWIFAFSTIALCQSYQDIQRLQNEYKKVLERQSLQKPKEVSDAEKTAESTALPDKLIYSRKDVESLLVNTENLLKELKFLQDSSIKMPYFGYDFFSKRDSIPFWENLPITKDYVLGPGDEIIISMWGESNSTYNETINRDGQIFLDNIGILNLGGKTVSESKKYIISNFSKVFSTLIGNNPKSFIDITLGELKSINVHFVGFVNIPGVHVVHPFSNIISGLTQAGGVKQSGSLREIELIRNGKTVKKFDLYSYLLNGKSIINLRLMDQDIVHIPARKSTIPITGRVKNPGYFELIDLENIDDLLNYSGGLKRRSSKTVFLYKNSDSLGIGYFVHPKEYPNFNLIQGDSVHVPLLEDVESYVRIEGQVKNSGKYPFNINLELYKLIKATRSLDDKNFMKTMDLSKIVIERRNPAGTDPIILRKNIEETFLLKNGDLITIGKTNYFQPLESVQITGEIKTPGIYTVNNLNTLSDLIDRSGGVTSNSLNNGIEIFRDSLKIAWSDMMFILEDGDSINVKKRTGLISIEGEVNVPGYLTFRKKDSLKKYIKRAGGYTAFADKKNIYIIYPNGESSTITSWPRPKIEEGSKIVVSQRMLSGNNQASGLQAFSMISSQAANIATTILTLTILANQNNNNN